MSEDPTSSSNSTFDSDSGIFLKFLLFRFQMDLEEIEKIRRSPKLSRRFHFLRYEDIAIEPETELSKLVTDLRNSPVSDSHVTFCRKSVEDTGASPDWNFEKNPTERVNTWKQKLSMESINDIEDQCFDVLSKLEYHIIGKEEA